MIPCGQTRADHVWAPNGRCTKCRYDIDMLED